MQFYKYSNLSSEVYEDITLLYKFFKTGSAVSKTNVDKVSTMWLQEISLL